MAPIKSLFIYLIGCVVFADAQNAEDFKQITSLLNDFALKLLAHTSAEATDSINLALSPYTVWSLMCVISEGALNNTAAELQTTLGIPSNKILFRNMYRTLANNLLQTTEGVSLDVSSAIFTSSKNNLTSNFKNIAANAYNVKVTPVNFDDKVTAIRFINQQMATATRNRIKNFISSGDINEAEILMTSALFFKGQWKVPFNKTATYTDEFYDSEGNRRGAVEMMYQTSTFPFSVVLDNKATAVELAYGKGDRMSMIVILPRRNENVLSVLKKLTETPIVTILDALARAEQDFVDEDVQVLLPKFNIMSDLTLNTVLSKMGIKDVFSLERANLGGMFYDLLHVERIIQKAIIQVDEEGTVASSITGGTFAYKSPPPRFKANKPFVYLIVDKLSQAIIFAGKVSNPDGLCRRCKGN